MNLKNYTNLENGYLKNVLRDHITKWRMIKKIYLPKSKKNFIRFIRYLKKIVNMNHFTDVTKRIHCIDKFKYTLKVKIVSYKLNIL